MKTKTLLFLLVIFTFLSYSQSVQIEWQQCFGGTENDYALDVIMIDDDYFVVGNTASDDGDISFIHGQGDIWMLKIDSIGSIIWEKTFGGSDGENVKKILLNNEGYYYLLGNTGSSDGDISYDPYPGNSDWWIIKIDSSGNIIWDKIVGGVPIGFLNTGITTDDGGVIALGLIADAGGDVSVHYGSNDIWMIKLDSEGEIEWDFTIGTDSQDFSGDIIQTKDGGYLVCSSSKIGNGGNLICEPFSYNAEAILVKLDADRNIEWQQCYGGSYHDGALELLEIEDGYMFAGYAGSNDGDISGWHGEMDIWLVKLDFYGNIIWQKCLGGGYHEVPKYLEQNEEGDFIIVGVTQSNNGDVSGNHSLTYSDHDIWVVKVNENGDVVWQHCFGGGEDETLYNGVLKIGENNYVMAGETNDDSGDVICNLHSWRYDFWVFEITIEDTTGINNIIEQDGIKVYPIPAGEYIVFESPPFVHPQGVKAYPVIQVFDVFGREVLREPVASERTVFDLRTIWNGVYFYQVELEGKMYSGKFIVQK